MKQRKKTTTTRAARNSTAQAPSEASSAAPPSARATYAVAAECTVADAGALKSELAKLLDNPEAVVLDITAVQRIDTAGLQVISAFVRERASQGRTVEWQGVAPVFSSAVRLLGLDSLLKVPEPA